MTARDEDEGLGPGEGGKDREPAEPMDAEAIARKDAMEYDEPERESLKSPGTGGDPEHKQKTRLSDNDMTT